MAPDGPMFVFYGYERLVRGTAERTLWSEVYFQADWQRLFDAFHSLPLIAVAAFFAWRLGSRSGLAFFASMALHSLADLAVHHDDAHAHFFPLSSWRFQSPVSYWDPFHYGQVFLWAELLLVLAGCGLLLRRSHLGWRYVGGVVLAAYSSFLVFAVMTWT